MKVTYYFREYRKGIFSIEVLFGTLVNKMIPVVKPTLFVVRSSTRLWSFVRAFFLQGELNHITGDVNYLALVLKGSKTVLTIHDIGHYEHTLSGWKKHVYKKIWFDWPLKRVARITTVSEFTKKKLLDTFGIDADKIKVIYNPVPSFFTPQDKVKHTGKYRILQVGSGANKNVERLIEAVEGLSCELLLLRRYDEQLDRKIKSAGIACVWYFDLSQEEVLQLYVKSDLVFFASTYEGFGMPIIEAQAVGRPVITSRLASMPEVGGDGVCLVNPYDVHDIKMAIEKITSDAFYCRDLVQKGFDNVQRFQVDRIAQEYIDLYRELNETKG